MSREKKRGEVQKWYDEWEKKTRLKSVENIHIESNGICAHFLLLLRFFFFLSSLIWYDICWASHLVMFIKFYMHKCSNVRSNPFIYTSPTPSISRLFFLVNTLVAMGVWWALSSDFMDIIPSESIFAAVEIFFSSTGAGAGAGVGGGGFRSWCECWHMRSYI